MKKSSFVFILYILSNVCFSQEKTKLTTFENEEYVLQYPSNLELRGFGPTNGMINDLFVISNFEEEVAVNFPLITLNVTDCSRLEMGVSALVESKEKGKEIKKRKTKINHTEFDEVISENEGIVAYEYVFVKNYKIYSLCSLAPKKEFDEGRELIESIMDTFELK